MGLIGPACTPRKGLSGRVLIGRGLTPTSPSSKHRGPQPHTHTRHQAHDDTQRGNTNSHPLSGSQAPNHTPPTPTPSNHIRRGPTAFCPFFVHIAQTITLRTVHAGVTHPRDTL